MDLLWDVTRDLPEMRPVAAMLDEEDGKPDKAEALFSSYLNLIDSLTDLSSDDFDTIRQANAILDAEDSKSNRAGPRRMTADRLVRSMGSDPLIFKDLIRASTDVSSDDVEGAKAALRMKLEQGHQIYATTGRTVDTKTSIPDDVILDHVDRYGYEALANTTIANYLQEYATRHLSSMNLDTTRQKDFFINALSDVLILDHISGQNKFRDIFEAWSRSRKAGGIGWITEKQIEAYSIVTRS